MKQKGALFTLQADISGTYTTIAACKSHTLTVNSEIVDVTEKSVLWRELIENAGISSVSIKAQGILTNSASYTFLKDAVIVGQLINCKMVSNTGEIYAGAFQITSFESSGEYNGAELVAFNLESANTTTIEDQNFLRLEDGGFFLLEDGGRIVLEAA